MVDSKAAATVVDQSITMLNDCIEVECKRLDLCNGDQGDWRTAPGGP